MDTNPYDDFPYRSLPIEWSAPERLALASFLHGGPRPGLDGYRVLELGCGDGANILPLAYYRRNAEFVGIDGSGKAIGHAERRRSELALSNLQLIHGDFLHADEAVSGRFDFIIAHGIFSWVSDEARDALFALCAARLSPSGLLYLNYNTKPGWNIRGMIREFLMTQTAGTGALGTRAELARELAGSVAASLDAGSEHPYTRLLANELRFVSQGHPSYVAHEFLEQHNRPYWRWDFLSLAQRYGLEHVADADFNLPSGRLQGELPSQLVDPRLPDRQREDTLDLLCYRQLHSPIFTPAPWTRRAPAHADLSQLVVASRLVPDPAAPAAPRMFRHPSGYEVEAKHDEMRVALEKLEPLWPRGLPVGELFPDGALVADDLRMLHRLGLIELRLAEPRLVASGVDAQPPEVLNARERAWGSYSTSPYHTLVFPA